MLGQKITPLERAGLYVPGGKAAYPSSVLMNSIPAKVAGVEELIMVVPTPNGVINELVLAAAHVAKVDLVITIGGAQAIAALAYGTESIPKVDKIVGPGNIYVATAKRQVFGQVGIDMIAGPSEILIICDGTTIQIGLLWIFFLKLNMMRMHRLFFYALVKILFRKWRKVLQNFSQLLRESKSSEHL